MYLAKYIISQLEGVQLANIQYQYLDGVLMNYRHLPSRIARRRLEIETEHSLDLNQGASKSNRINKRTEWLVERFDGDIKLKNLECQLNAVEATLELLDDTMKQVFTFRWIEGYTPEEIADMMGAPLKLTKKRLERIIEIFADFWGWT